MKKNQLYVRVPGTSANLGPGFDIMGLALDIYNEFYFDFSVNANFSIQLIDGSTPPFSKEEDLVHIAYNEYFNTFLNGREIIPYNSVMNLELPLKGGLGSSASAVVAGYSAAREAHRKFYYKTTLPTDPEFLYRIAKFEGHPDNTIPAYLGGVVLAFFGVEGTLHYFKKNFPKNISLFIFTPTIHVETIDSRKKLPELYRVDDVIFNMSRIATWFEFLEHKKYKFLQLALEDKLHTPYRISNIPTLIQISSIVQELGGLYSLSGSGPSLLIYCKKKEMKKFYIQLKKSIQEIMYNSGVPYTLKKVNLDSRGIKINWK